ncbi:transposase [Streptomyces sp. TBY4]|uniref:IS701 family transposase n=1 Tax=Streptomyces sp. TBY4 TaxID=2962030 RepID=UPI0020B68078|nr:transposase [Streptomyces sp. TBY4]MCP3758835.1 transposase [Streptomyces sp. TBY4]
MAVTGATGRGPAGDRTSVSAFSQELFAQLPRTDQMKWAEVYLRGLLATRGRKSVRRMAETVTTSATASQSLQQFVNTSPWDWNATRQELARWIDGRFTPQAWTVVPAVLPKRGSHSVGVHRRFVPELDRTINCQLSVGLFLSGGREHLPVGWRLHLPERWTKDPEARRRARVPDSVPFRPHWAHTVGLVDALSAHSSVVPAPVVADVGSTPDARPVVERLNGSGHGFVLAVADDLQLLPDPSPVRPAGTGTGGGRPAAESARQKLLHSGVRHPHITTVVGQDGRPRRAQVVSVPVRTPVLRPDGTRTVAAGLLFAEWEPARRRPGRIWLTNLVHRRMEELLALTQLLQGAVDTVAAMGEHHGIQDFEGRSFPGWHRHMTLVSAAYAYQRLSGPLPVPARAA